MGHIYKNFDGSTKRPRVNENYNPNIYDILITRIEAFDAELEHIELDRACSVLMTSFFLFFSYFLFSLFRFLIMPYLVFVFNNLYTSFTL